MNNVLPDGTVNDTKEGPCAICLEETITNPVVLPCGHAFCFACVGHYKCSSNSKDAACPYCRGEIPDVTGKAMERSTLYQDRARTSSKGSDNQKKYAKLALSEFESLMELFDPNVVIKEGYMEVMYTKLMMTSMTGQPEETIKVTGEVLSLDKQHRGVYNFDRVAQVKHWKAEAYSDCGKWKDAVKSYKSLVKEYKQRKKVPSSLIFTGYSRALYELQKYDEAIVFGKLAIEVNRSNPGVHKYVALSHKALGDIDGAKKNMLRAILYEEHWDRDNLQKNKELLRELNNI